MQDAHDLGESSPERHRAEAEAHTDALLTIAVITASDTRTADDDVSGAWLCNAIAEHGHRLVVHLRCPDEREAIGAALDEAVDRGARAVLLTGGTGIARRDVTADVVEARLERALPGFGELFRMLSFHEVGAAAMLSRALAGTYRGAFVVALPGSTAAVRLAWERLLAPELRHVVRELDR